MSTGIVNVGLTAPQWQLEFRGPDDVARFDPVVNGAKRIIPNVAAFDPQATPANAVTARALLNETLLVPNVTSFQVQVLQSGFPPGFTDLTGGIYDTTQMTNAASVNRIGLKAIQVTIRVFDSKTKQSRQISVVSDM